MASEAARSHEFVEHSTEAAVEEKAKLQKPFSRFDSFSFLICSLVGLFHRPGRPTRQRQIDVALVDEPAAMATAP